MQWFYALGLPCVAGAVAWGLVALPSKSTGEGRGWADCPRPLAGQVDQRPTLLDPPGLGVRLDVGLAWASALFMLMLGVPLDVAAALRERGVEGGGEGQLEGQLAALWRWSYW